MFNILTVFQLKTPSSVKTAGSGGHSEPKRAAESLLQMGGCDHNLSPLYHGILSIDICLECESGGILGNKVSLYTRTHVYNTEKWPLS